jgi:nicotinate-nucleotide adenylyltransferase
MAENTEIWFGGTFDPVHHGHLITARSVAEATGADRIVLVPTGRNPLKDSPQASPEQRLAMLELAVRNDDMFDISLIELHSDSPCYTIDTVQKALSERGEAPGEVCLLVGADSIGELPSWHRVDELLDTVRLLVACRPPMSPDRISRDIADLSDRLGEDRLKMLKESIVSTPMIDISSTDIRRRVKSGESIRYLVPEAVEGYIVGERLYF